MRALISLTIIAAVLISANSTWKRIERDFAPKATSSMKASIDQLNSSITNTVTKTTSNPFTATTAKTEAVAPKTNETPAVIIRPRDCSGMDCYKDMETEIPVIVAKNI